MPPDKSVRCSYLSDRGRSKDRLSGDCGREECNECCCRDLSGLGTIPIRTRAATSSATGDPVADCAAEWRRETGHAAPELVAYDSGNGDLNLGRALELACTLKTP